MQQRPFLSPIEVATELGVSTSTVLRLIHAGRLPAIAVSERIYRIPAASFELFVAGALHTPEPAPLGELRPRPAIGAGEPAPAALRGTYARQA